MTASDLLSVLHSRVSVPVLTDPGPSAAHLEDIFRAGLRAPDHRSLRPWRYLVVEGEHRRRLGQLFESALMQRDPAADLAAREKARNAPLRAPVLVIAVTRFVEREVVPAIEQSLSTGAAVGMMLTAAHALGYGAIWRTGWYAYDPLVQEGLGLEEGEAIAGFVYLGTIDCRLKPLPQLDIHDYFRPWEGTTADEPSENQVSQPDAGPTDR